LFVETYKLMDDVHQLPLLKSNTNNMAIIETNKENETSKFFQSTFYT